MGLGGAPYTLTVGRGGDTLNEVTERAPVPETSVWPGPSHGIFLVPVTWVPALPTAEELPVGL